jgi:uncharacterized protein YceH (UPF0502 family)
VHLFSGEVDVSQFVAESVPTVEDVSRIDALEQRVRELEEELRRLKELLT